MNRLGLLYVTYVTYVTYLDGLASSWRKAALLVDVPAVGLMSIDVRGTAPWVLSSSVLPYFRTGYGSTAGAVLPYNLQPYVALSTASRVGRAWLRLEHNARFFALLPYSPPPPPLPPPTLFVQCPRPVLSGRLGLPQYVNRGDPFPATPQTTHPTQRSNKHQPSQMARQR